MSSPSSFFEAGGIAASVIDDFRIRPGQAAMADAVAGAIDAGEDLLVEAGTGTGKTFAYLLPILLSGKKAIVSTATKTLQDQLWQTDLPRIKKLVGPDFRFALLKGRANYVCPERLHRHIRDRPRHASADEVSRRLLDVRQWLPRTRTGDLGEVLDTEAESSILPLMTSTSDNCLGRKCAYLDECPLYRARQRAVEADLVVVNHHLLLADMTLDDELAQPLLPRADIILMDEAHRAADTARQFLGHRLSSRQLTELAKEVIAEYRALGAEDIGVFDAARQLDQATTRLGECWNGGEEDGDAIDELDLAFSGLISALDASRSRSRVYEQCYARSTRFADLFALLTDALAPRDGYARWRDQTNGGFVLNLSPVSIADDFGARIRGAGQSWIFTSATLSIGGTFDHVVAELGLGDIRTERFDSPFDFASQVSGWVPPLCAPPGSREHTLELVDACLPLLRSCTGRAFFLFTSHRALRDAAARLNEIGCLNCLVQGTASRSSLLEQFRRTERATLLATQSFWEGVDVRGAGLRLLIIDKLPFPSPSDPLVRARTEALEANGRDSFMDLMLPEAVTGLRQGFGRLIREESDHGVFVLGDTRIQTRAYGAMVRASLPAFEWLSSAPVSFDRKELA